MEEGIKPGLSFPPLLCTWARPVSGAHAYKDGIPGRDPRNQGSHTRKMQDIATGTAMRSVFGLVLGLSLSLAMTVHKNHSPYPGEPPPESKLPPSLPHPPMPPPWFGPDLLLPNSSAELDPAMSLCSMMLDAPEPPTADQVPWFCICSACGGTPGPKGECGDPGPPGVPGSPGRRGVTGFRGLPGFKGPQGLKGGKGDMGQKGDQGALGLPGPKGGRGFKGEKGDLGMDGPAGEPGPKGDDGQCPDTCQAVQGLPGDPGLPGPAGPRGLPGLAGAAGAAGLKGDPGEVGSPGAPGAVGPRGEQGEEGQCDCQDGAKGEDGAAGQKGDRGDPGPQGSGGIKGMEGQKGDQGEMGMMGRPGPCAPLIQSSFSVGLATPFPPPNLPVVFTHIHSNMQGHYDPTVGIYRSPVNGTYIFSYHLTVFNRVLKVGLFHNYLPVVKTTAPVELGTASQQVVLHLSQGDMVWLQVRDSLTNGMYTSSEASSTFSGVLLYPDTCDMPFGRDFMMPPITGEYSWGAVDDPAP